MAADRRGAARRAAVGGLLAALSVVVLWLGGLLPGYVIAAAAVAGLLPAAAVLEGGAGLGAAVFGVSAVLGLLLLPEKAAGIWYLAFFGWYSLLKSWLERRRSRALEWVLKACAYTAAFLALYFLARGAFSALTDLVPWGVPAAYALGLGAFVLYDIGFSRLIGLYLRRIRRNFGKGE